jgi:Flp pilus assembly protein TadD
MRSMLAGIFVVGSLLSAPATTRATPKDAAPAPAPVTHTTDEAARGQRLLERGSYSEAASVLRRVASGANGEAEATRQLAHYQLAIALYRLRFYQASSAIFSEIADNPRHLRFKETFPWLAQLSIELPEPSEIIERVGKYPSEHLARLDNPAQRDLYYQLNFLLGRYKFRNHNYEEAIRLLNKVGAASKRYVEAQILLGTSYIKLRKTAPAIRSFQRGVMVVEAGNKRP